MLEGKRHGDLAAVMMVKDHTIIAGVSEKLGGRNEGPDPHDLLEAALAACTIITVQMYANRKQWPLQDVKVRIRIDSEGKETHMTREIELIGDLSGEQRQRLAEIAEKCPIHRILTSPTTIATQVTEPS